MANEITITVSLQCVNGNFNPGTITYTKQITQNAIGAHSPVQICSTSIEAIATGDLSTYGIMYLRNLDATNFVTYGSTANLEFKLKPGEAALHRVTPAASLGIKADTGACKVQFLWLED